MTNDLTKVYANLDPAQLALLAFNHLADSDPLERERILSAVPQRAYLTNDKRFTEMHISLFTLLDKMSGIYWKSRAEYYQRLYIGYDEAQAIKSHKSVVLAIQHTVERLGVIEEVLRVYFMTGDIFELIDDDQPIDWELYQSYLDGFSTYLK